MENPKDHRLQTIPTKNNHWNTIGRIKYTISIPAKVWYRFHRASYTLIGLYVWNDRNDHKPFIQNTILPPTLRIGQSAPQWNLWAPRTRWSSGPRFAGSLEQKPSADSRNCGKLPGMPLQGPFQRKWPDRWVAWVEPEKKIFVNINTQIKLVFLETTINSLVFIPIKMDVYDCRWHQF